MITYLLVTTSLLCCVDSTNVDENLVKQHDSDDHDQDIDTYSLDTSKQLTLGKSPLDLLNVESRTILKVDENKNKFGLLGLINHGHNHNKPHVDDYPLSDKKKNRRRHTKKRKNSHKRSNVERLNKRKRKRTRHGLRRHVCPSKTMYVFKTEAEDIFENTVKVHPVIQIKNLTIDQLFYESFCPEEKCNCGGVDKDKFMSSCETTYSYSYARVVKNGQIGWSFIKTRSGCSCVVRERSFSGTTSILDVLRK